MAPFAHLFRRSESRQSVERYTTGLLTDADWDALAMDELRVRRLPAHSPPGGALVLDDTGLPKQGKHSLDDGGRDTDAAEETSWVAA